MNLTKKNAGSRNFHIVKVDLKMATMDRIYRDNSFIVKAREPSLICVITY